MVVQELTKEATDREITVQGIKIHYNEAGSGPTLICFHGGGPGASAWGNSRYCLPLLSQHFRCILMDLPGYGGSAKDAKLNGEPLDVFLARLVVSVMDQLDIDKAHLYTSSQSGPMGLRVGIDYPDRVGKIVMQSSSPERGGQLMFSSSPSEGLKALAVFAQNPIRENMEKMMHLFIPKDELCTEEIIDARFRAALTPGHIEARREFSASKNSDLSQLVRNLKAEVLVVWGYQDRMVPVEGAFRALVLIPNVRLHIWGGGTGHFVAYEKAEEFARLVIDFLSH
jgi:4,5:9,10-diseco-3-hydroxy-5,9,17-trioxoandrosta-1(10),2-diene-4-oate hydrolase